MSKLGFPKRRLKPPRLFVRCTEWDAPKQQKKQVKVLPHRKGSDLVLFRFRDVFLTWLFPYPPVSTLSFMPTARHSRDS